MTDALPIPRIDGRSTQRRGALVHPMYDALVSGDLP